MLSTLPVELASAVRVDLDRRRAGRGACRCSCVSLKFAVTHTSSSGTIAISGWPAARPGRRSTLFRLTMPLDRRLDGRVLQVQLGLRQRRLAPAATCASAAAARALVAVTCCGPVCARLQLGVRLLLAGAAPAPAGSRRRGCRPRLRRPAIAPSRPRPSAPRRRRPPRRTAAARLRPWRAALAAARRRAPPWRRWLRLRAARACAVASRARAASISLLGACRRRRAPGRRRRCAVVTLLAAVVDVIGTLLCAASGGRLRRRRARRAPCRRRPGSRADRSRRARAPASTSWLSSTGTRSTVPPTRAAIGVTCASTCASSVDSRPAVSHNQTPTPTTTSTTTPTMRESPSWRTTCCADRPSASASEILTQRPLRRCRGRARAAPSRRCSRTARRCTARWRRATASCACTTSMLLATPAAKRSRACVSCCAASSRARVGDLQLLAGGLEIEKRGAHVVVDRRPSGPRPRRGGCAGRRRPRAAGPACGRPGRSAR